MGDNSTSRRAAGFLLDLIDAGAAQRVRRRIGVPPHTRVDSAGERARLISSWTWRAVPSSVLLWVLEEDDPDLNAVVWRHSHADDFMRRAILRGVPFGPGRTARVPVAPVLRHSGEPPVPACYARQGLIGALRRATAMAPARKAASMVLERADWRTVGEADAERPLPGYARWALAVRPDCPPRLRTQFGVHRKFTNRVRGAGVLDGPAEYATAHGPASDTLQVLSLGHLLFPARVRDAEDALRPLVRDHLGGREEAWAVLAQLVDGFHGTVPELVATAGAVA
ncbi:hypothetical protein ACIRPX_41420 [Streptomyces sp. NPDC101225]|uniref:hypothetical protein n=1 Tax=Streptomyces sp. NPDC101225 TaxID=3366135 RepID=UPI00381F11AE